MTDNTSNWRDAATEEYRSRRAQLVAGRDRFLEQARRYREKADHADREIRRLDDGARAFGLPAFESDEQESEASILATTVPGRTGGLFKDAALDLLKEAYPQGLRAADIQQKGEEKLARKFHSKTAGMTLYRLSLEGLAERRGWDWFYVPDEERQRRRLFAENIAGSTGLEDLLTPPEK